MGQLILFVDGLKIEMNLTNTVTLAITIFICYLLNVKFAGKVGRYSKKREPCVLYFFLVRISYKYGAHARVDRIHVNLK